MKRQGSNVRDLSDIFSKEITVAHICSDIESRPKDEKAISVREYMAQKHFSVMGITDRGIVCGYVKQDELGAGTCENYKRDFEKGETIADSTPLLDVLNLLYENDRIFVQKGNMVTGIATRADLNKIPVRMLVFGLFTIFEMCISKIIWKESNYDDFKRILDPKQLSKAEKLHKLRIARDEDLELVDCFELSDKIKLFLDISRIKELPQIKSNREIIKSVPDVRNRVAHGRDLVARKSDWPKIIDLAKSLQEQILPCCEDYVSELEGSPPVTL